MKTIALGPFQWECPYCNRPTTIISNNHIRSYSDLHITNASGPRRIYVDWIVCPNPECHQYSLTSSIFKLYQDPHLVGWQEDEIASWNLIPGTSAKIFPDYVPQAIIQDYNEACSIAGLSPKASATLARRCLQGMIRDFWKVSKKRLVDEIDGIRDKVDPVTWQAIDAVRKIGNIGAHMEKDINLIIDVEPNEVELLIRLIETLINDWYINRHEREQNFNKIISASRVKELQKKKETEEKTL